MNVLASILESHPLKWPSSFRSRRSSRARAVVAALGLVAGASARAQQPPAPPPTPPPAPSPVIARIEGRSITERDFDRIAEPYFERLRAQLKEGFSEELKRMARKNVMDEIIRRELLAI